MVRFVILSLSWQQRESWPCILIRSGCGGANNNIGKTYNIIIMVRESEAHRQGRSVCIDLEFVWRLS